MKKLAWAVLVQGRAQERLCTIELVVLDLPGDDASARHVVTRRDQLFDQGVLRAESESTLTTMPVALAAARHRALEYLERRLAAGDVLREQQGFDELEGCAPAVAAAPPVSAAPAQGSTVSPAVAALVARFQPSAWKLLPPARQARSVWRVAERADPARADSADQRALRALVPQFVGLLERGDDLLDYCLAAAIARLGDAGARQAMAALAQRGRSAATRRIAHQAWLLLGVDDPARAEQLAALAAGWHGQAAQMLQRAGAAAPPDEEQPQPVLDGPARDALSQWLIDGYDLALTDAQALQSVRSCLRRIRLEAGVFGAVRAIHKTAELRRDLDTLALLHARFESTRPDAQDRRAWRDPRTGELRTRAMDIRSGKGLISAYAVPTRNYLRQRGLRLLRRLVQIDHSDAAPLAVALLLQLDDELHAQGRAREDWAMVEGRYRRRTRFMDGSAHWLLVPHLLLARWPELCRSSQRGGAWWTDRPLDLQQPLAQRVDGEPALWDAHPEALLTLALRSRSALVQWVVARALHDHLGFVAQAPLASLRRLLASPYAHTAAVGVAAVREVLAQLPDLEAQLPWLMALAASRDVGAAALLAEVLARHGAQAARQSTLVAALLLSPQAAVRLQGQALALTAEVPPLLLALQEALPLLDEDTPELAAICEQLQSLLAGNWASHAAQVPPEPLHGLLTHAALPLVQLGTAWVLRHPAALAGLPPTTLRALLAATDAGRVACGVRLLAALPDAVLLSQAALLAEFALHADAGVRAAVTPAIERLARDAQAGPELARHLHAALFRSEAAEGLHDDLLRWLTGPLADVAPGRDADGCWRALQARATGAQRYGAWALAGQGDSAFSLRQWARLVAHADAAVRQRAQQALDARLTQGARITPEDAAELLPAADSVFEDVQPWVRELFGRRLPDEALTPELLIAWIDHPQAWVQAQGRTRLMGRMQAPEAMLCLTRLAQHPGPSVQLFVTQWLLQLPAEDDAARAERLRTLQPYFLMALSQVHRARAAKSRIVQFLRQQIAGPACAEVVAAIFARQVVGASRTDQPQYIAGLRDIAARHPQLALPFMRWVPPEARGLAAQAAA
ncbi:hypothetical protein PGB34_16735 [Xenophilus arseniciresistens]|uniref:Uncharacterized protein n=1 Tax=Xenophilus arseniciresistens TaxID=1283306 RepID=A0AAE3T235_9BURK|nr:hypothetical protein [Xenophilus arseniciresistens]MDA7418012.1 hypothetical protein [Xenophilus arseniciresistens]